MARDYWFRFGSGNPTTHASLSPIFIFFANTSGVTFAAPAINERYPGSGMYVVNYNATTTIGFVIDGATTGLVNADRYIAGVFDPQDMFGQTLVPIGVTLSGIGNTVSAMGLTLGTIAGTIGNTASSFGTDVSDPTTVMGFLKRAQEMSEGNRTYLKASGALDYYSRGSSQLLREKMVSDSPTGTTLI